MLLKRNNSCELLFSETKEILRRFGERSESYNNIIRKLIKAGWKGLDEQWNTGYVIEVLKRSRGY